MAREARSGLGMGQIDPRFRETLAGEGRLVPREPSFAIPAPPGDGEPTVAWHLRRWRGLEGGMTKLTNSSAAP